MRSNCIHLTSSSEDHRSVGGRPRRRTDRGIGSGGWGAKCEVRWGCQEILSYLCRQQQPFSTLTAFSLLQRRQFFASNPIYIFCGVYKGMTISADSVLRMISLLLIHSHGDFMDHRLHREPLRLAASTHRGSLEFTNRPSHGNASQHTSVNGATDDRICFSFCSQVGSAENPQQRCQTRRRGVISFLQEAAAAPPSLVDPTFASQ